MYLLDTNICIYAMKGRYPFLTDKLLSIPPDRIQISSVSVGELYYGAAKSKWGPRTRAILELFLASYDLLDFSEADAKEWGMVRGELAVHGMPIGPYDAMIVGQARRRGMTVVTNNTGEFMRVRGLSVEDWTRPQDNS